MASNSTNLYSSNYPSSSPYTLTATVVENSHNDANNTSNVTITATLASGGVHFSGYSTPTLSVEYKDNGSNTTYTAKKTEQISSITSGTPSRSVSWTGDVAHKEDGTLSVSVKAVWLYKDSGTGYAPKSGNVEVTLALTTIPRAGSVSVSPVNATISTSNGSTVLTATVTPQSSSYYHRISAKIGNTSVMTDVWAEDNSMKGYITDQSLLNALPTSASGTVTVTVKTYATKSTSGTLIGTKTATATVTVDLSAIKPSFSSHSFAIDTTPISGRFVAGYSTGKVNYSGSPGYGASTVTQQTTLSRGTMATSTVTNPLPPSDTDYTLTVEMKLTDSRGATFGVGHVATIYGYTPPIISITAYRVASSGSTTADEAGTYVYVTYSATAKSLGNNTILSTTATYAGDVSGTLSQSPSWIALSENKGLTLTVTATDRVTSATLQKSVGVATFPLDLYQEGGVVGVGLAGVAEPGRVTAYQPLQTSFKKSFATGSYGTAQTTVAGLVGEVRFSSGAMGSVSINTAYTLNGITIPTGWYNFIYSPHRNGGINGAAQGDNCNYGNLFLLGMNNRNGMFRLRIDSGAVNQVIKYGENSWNIYTSVAELGQTDGSATISALWSAMPDGSMLICQASQLASSNRPDTATTGMIEIVRRASGRGWLYAYGKGETNYDYRMYLNSSNVPSGTWRRIYNGSYSTTEQDTGSTWVDGKTIYKKTLSWNNTAIANGTTWSHNIASINEVVKVEAHLNADGTYIGFPSTTNNTANDLGLRVSKTQIIFFGNDSWGANTNRTIYVTIYYTKT